VRLGQIQADVARTIGEKLARVLAAGPGASSPRPRPATRADGFYASLAYVQPTLLHRLYLRNISNPVPPQVGHSAQSPALLALRIPPPHFFFVPAMMRLHLAPTVAISPCATPHLMQRAAGFERL
jgi:hypothetical protein